MGRVEWPGLMEREHELEAIDVALGGVDEGVGAFLLFDGEPGIGKSALLHALTVRARARHVRVLAARAAQGRNELTQQIRVPGHLQQHPSRGGPSMAEFRSPTDLRHNRGLIADPTAFAHESGAASWLYMCGEEFVSMEGGMSYADVQAAVPESINLVADPPREFDMDVARRGVAALDELPRPTLVTCRTGPRSSALVYLYSGLRSGAFADDVLARAEADGAPFAQAPPLREWVKQGLAELS